MNDEAKASFIDFRDAYTRRFGNRWSRWVIDNANVEHLVANDSASRDRQVKLERTVSTKDLCKERRKSIAGGSMGAGKGSGRGAGIMNMFRTVKRNLE